jgi:16S rRNA (cytidine1402-2'-O)-methyltransferase
VSASFSLALAASVQAASDQHYPHSTLYVMATPIGNLADISLRALHVLTLADIVACEDTRHTQAMLRAYGIDKAAHQLMAVHQHNESQAATTVMNHLRNGSRVVLVSDAGTPGISDPGARLVSLVQVQGLRCLPLPGPSSVTTLLSVAGLPAEHGAEPGFIFHGFLPSRATERERAIESLAAQTRAVVLLEAPHRIEALAQALAGLGDRLLTVGRELTKQFEEVTTLPAHQLPAWLAQDTHRVRGEFALVIHPPATAAPESGAETRVLALLLDHLPLKTAVKLAADITGQGRNDLYEKALGLKAQKADGDHKSSSNPHEY